MENRLICTTVLAVACIASTAQAHSLSPGREYWCSSLYMEFVKDAGNAALEAEKQAEKLREKQEVVFNLMKDRNSRSPDSVDLYQQETAMYLGHLHALSRDVANLKYWHTLTIQMLEELMCHQGE